MDSMPRPNPRNAGFSLVELVTVIVLIGVLAAIAVPRMGGSGAYEERAGTDRLISALRFAQQQAMSRLATVAVCDADSGGNFGIAMAISKDGASSWNDLSPPTGSKRHSACPPGNSHNDNVWHMGADVSFPQDPIYIGSKGMRVNSNGVPYDNYENGDHDVEFHVKDNSSAVCLYGLTGFPAKGGC